ncbi:hypothetical protein ASPCAL13886 [Aspergillus calidoustus]|uniref:GPI-anchored cell surface glycoprotein n=1 Tax=Aspergillus calidoustus TaxID=454130 RepID=A0A0U4ZMN0_ASPCI|nr:hypothetical protein ASPCAL13886 [Aspergillus calidoustus]
MVARSVTRELGSPALPDLTSRTAHPELNTSNVPQSSYSLPPTPLTSSFEEVLPSKRRRTQRAIHSEDKTLPSKSVLETPTHRAFSEPSQTPKSTRPTRNSNLILSTSQSSSAVDTPQKAPTPGSSKSTPTATPGQPQTEQGAISPRKLPLRNQTITVKPEPSETTKDSEMGAGMSHTRKTRQSMSTRLNDAGQENGTPTKASSADASTPQSSRRDRRSRLAAHTGTKITKPPPDTPAAATAKTPNGVNKSATSVKQTPAETPNTSTRSRRRDRRSSRVLDQTPSQDKASENATAQNTSEHPSPQRSNRLSNTVTLNVGRKSLESILAQQQAKRNAQDEAAQVAPPENDNHLEYDSAMYRNNYGLDGQMDAPTSPNSMSTSTSTAARTSGRARKPTARALESFESEQRYRRPRAPSAKPSAAADTTTNAANTDTAEVRSRSRQKPSPQPPTSTAPTPALDIAALAKQIYELAAAALADDFVLPPETEKWFAELQHKFDGQHRKKEAEATELPPPAEPVEAVAAADPDEASEAVESFEPTEAAEPAQPAQPSEPNEAAEPLPRTEEEAEAEETPPTSETFLENVQVSDPWTDADGWEHTGQHNKHGEEFVIVGPKYEWYRPNYTYGDKDLPQPPVRLRSYVQSEADRVFGYPPCIGDRNVPADIKGFFLLENVPEERAKLKAKEAARARGIIVTRYMPLHEIELLISLYDNGQPPPPPAPAPESVAESKPPASTRKRRRAGTASTPKDPAETPNPKRRRQETENPTPSEPAAIEPATELVPEPASEPAPEPPSEPSTEEEASSPDKKSLKITLSFGKKKFMLEDIASSDSAATREQSKKRPHSELEETTTTPEKSHGHDTRSPKVQKVSTAPTAQKTPNETSTVPKATQSMGPPSTPAKTAETKTNATPGSSEQFSTETTPGGRPRRRAAQALIAGFQVHAEDRARRAERARAAHARRKGTPLKNVTALNESHAESPIRPAAVNPMNVDKN